MATFEGEILVNTGRGILFHGNYWHGPLWFPTSQCTVTYDLDAPFEVVVEVRDWLARKRGIFEFTEYTAEEIEEIDSL